MNYIGSKYSLLEFLVNTIQSVVGVNNNLVFADLFAGTGVVGCKFKELGFQVISNDIQYYSYVLNRHLITNTPPLDVANIQQHLNSLQGIKGFVYNNYCAGSNSGRNYFTDNNGMKCDAIRNELEMLKNNGDINENQYFYLLASLINSIDKYANTASIYGAFLKHIKASAQKDFYRDLLPIIDSEYQNTVYNMDANKLITKIKGDVLYLDPPYNARQYCTNYHVLETIAKYDNPVLYGKTGLREYSSQKSKYCSKITVTNEFEELIKNANFKYIFLSYNNEGLMTIETIQNIMKKYGNYDIFEKPYKRFRADKENARNHKANKTNEYIHCLIKYGFPPTPPEFL